MYRNANEFLLSKVISKNIERSNQGQLSKPKKMKTEQYFHLKIKRNIYRYATRYRTRSQVDSIVTKIKNNDQVEPMDQTGIICTARQAWILCFRAIHNYKIEKKKRSDN